MESSSATPAATLQAMISIDAGKPQNNSDQNKSCTSRSTSSNITIEYRCSSISTPIPKRKMYSLTAAMTPPTLSQQDNSHSCFPNSPSTISSSNNANSPSSPSSSSRLARRKQQKTGQLEYFYMILWEYPTSSLSRTHTALRRTAPIIMINILMQSSELIYWRLSHYISHISTKMMRN